MKPGSRLADLLGPAGDGNQPFTSMSFRDIIADIAKKGAAGTSSSPRSMPTIDKGPHLPRTQAGRPSKPLGPRARRLDQRRRSIAAHPWSWRRWGAETLPSRHSMRAEGVDVVLAGTGPTIPRRPAADGDPRPGFDPAASPWQHGQDHGNAAPLCAEPVGRNRPWGYLRRDHFEDRAAQSCRTLHHGLGGRPHTLYEKGPHPFLLAGPGGTPRSLQPAGTSRWTDRRRARIGAAAFEPSKHYTVKLEGAKTLRAGAASSSPGARRSDLSSPRSTDIPRQGYWPARAAPTSPKCRKRPTASFPISTGKERR